MPTQEELDNLINEKKTELSNVENDLVNAKNELGGVSDTKNSMDREIEELTKTVEAKEKEVEACQKRVEECQKLVEEQESKLPPLVEEEKELTIALKIAKEAAKQLEKDFSDLKNDVKATEIAMDEYIMNNRESENDKRKAFEADIAELEDRKSKVADDLKDLKVKKTAKEAEVETIESRITSLKASVASLEEENERLETLLEKNKDIVSRSISEQNEILETVKKANVELLEIRTTIGMEQEAKNQAVAELEQVKSEIGAINLRAFAIKRREDDMTQKQQYIERLYDDAGVPYTPYSE